MNRRIHDEFRREEEQAFVKGGIRYGVPFVLFFYTTVILYLVSGAAIAAFFALFGLNFSLYPLGCFVFSTFVWVIAVGYPVLQTSRNTTLDVIEGIASIIRARVKFAEAIAEAALADAEATRIEATNSPVQRHILVGGSLRKRNELELPNGEVIDELVLVDFLVGALQEGKGISRDSWCPPMRREHYDGILDLLSSAGLLSGRKAGYSGRLTYGLANTMHSLGLLDKYEDRVRMDANGTGFSN